jgi:hypothetical protein
MKKEIKYLELAKVEKEKKGRSVQFYRIVANRCRLLQKEIAEFDKQKKA